MEYKNVVRFFRSTKLTELQNELENYMNENNVQKEDTIKVYFNTEFNGNAPDGYELVNTVLIIHRVPL